MSRKNKRFETFAERDRKKLVKDSFGNIFAAACFFCISQPLFNFIPRLIFWYEPSTELAVCAKIAVTLIFRGLGVYMPFLIYQILSTGKTDTCFRRSSEARARHYILGVPAAACIGAGIWYVSSVFVDGLRLGGYVITEAQPDISGSLLQGVVFIVFSALAIPLFEEMAFRGVLMGALSDKAGGWSVLVSAVVAACGHPTFFQFPYALAVNLLIALMYYRTRSLWLSYALNAAASGAVSAVYVFYMKYPETYAEYMPVIFRIIAAAGAVLTAGAVFAAVKSPRSARRDFSTGECVKGIFLSFLFWVLIISAGFRLSLNIYKPDPEENAPETEEYSSDQTMPETEEYFSDQTMPGTETYEPGNALPDARYAFGTEDNISDA